MEKFLKLTKLLQNRFLRNYLQAASFDTVSTVIEVKLQLESYHYEVVFSFELV